MSEPLEPTEEQLRALATAAFEDEQAITDWRYPAIGVGVAASDAPMEESTRRRMLECWALVRDQVPETERMDLVVATSLLQAVEVAVKQLSDHGVKTTLTAALQDGIRSFLARRAGGPVLSPVTIHWLRAGRAACGLPGFPGEWPPGHRWSGTLVEVTCRQCLPL